MTIVVFAIGLLFLWLVVKLAEGFIKLVLILILLGLIASGAMVTSNSGNEQLPASTNL